MTEKQLSELAGKLAEYLGYDMEALMHKNRERGVAVSRQKIMSVLRSKCNMYSILTFNGIGKLFNRDHATVINACNQMSNLCQFDKEFESAYEIFATYASRCFLDHELTRVEEPEPEKEFMCKYSL
jgi:chromosomal replication initiation ATPase DnaA